MLQLCMTFKHRRENLLNPSVYGGLLLAEWHTELEEKEKMHKTAELTSTNYHFLVVTQLAQQGKGAGHPHWRRLPNVQGQEIISHCFRTKPN